VNENKKLTIIEYNIEMNPNRKKEFRLNGFWGKELAPCMKPNVDARTSIGTTSPRYRIVADMNNKRGAKAKTLLPTINAAVQSNASW
jgi:hypothetical protein